MEASVTLKNISKHFNKKYVLSNLSFGIEKGSAFAIIGRNGAGKTTFLRVLSTLLKPDNGNVYINGMDMAENMGEIKKAIGYLPDHDIHDSWMTGMENLRVRANYIGIDKADFWKVVEPFVNMFDLKDHLNQCPVTYSRGTKRCLDLVQILMGDPQILVLDEPLLGLDFKIRTVLCKYLLKQKGQKTIIIASNEFTEIQTIADRWIVLHEGAIRFDGTIEKMVTNMEIPFIGNLEFKNKEKDYITELRKNPKIKHVRNLGNTIQIVTEDIIGFQEIIKQIDPDEILTISGNSNNIEEFINQLLSDEGF